MTTSLVFTVPGMTCGHCVAAVTKEVEAVAGVTRVDIDLPTKAVLVTGVDLAREAVWAAVEEAGFEAVS